MSGTGRYLFAVARDLRVAELTGTQGFHGTPIDVVERDGLSAVVCDVDLGEFGEEPLTRNLEDLTWVERVARTHNDVVWRVAAAATCAPLRLVTVCADDDSVRAKVDSLRTELENVLDRIEGRQEWSVKVLVPQGAAVEAEPAATPTSGTDYLRRKREAAERRRDLSDEAVRAAREVHDVGHAHAVASRQLAPQDPRLTGRTETMILNAAYLVEAGEHEVFTTALRAAAEQHPSVTVEVEGPWPAYSFAVLG
ncbi:MAG TPA: GvpL/GvpF family gas vesicle protein [Nocardioides sp.]|uniref:GvpL/GvpF family gas vesicle protein n=1 Tax=Nocardioides sp. TaxID=35761 RepID=UPI002E34C89D|nr:GvpL/GvpF family gas vesicle protein [Nocardioides sp.]HEX5086831.1 GvpL/GvpF family gas vesicle protein [Nocardioides sp.]